MNVEPNHGNGKSKKSIKDRRRRERLFRSQSGKCHWCGDQMELNPLRTTPLGNVKENSAYASFEHLMPRSSGGKTVARNIVLAHVACNGKRHIKRWSHDPIYGRAR